MAEHEVYISQLPRLDIQYSDVEFEIRSDGELLGHLGISRGTLSWTPSGSARRHVDWERLSELSGEWPRW